MTPPPPAGATDARPALGLAPASLGQADLAELLHCTGTAGVSVSVPPALYVAARRAGLSDAALGALLSRTGARVHAIEPVLRGLPGCPAPADVPSPLRSYFEPDEQTCHDAARALGAEALYVSHFLGAPVGVAELAAAIGALAARARERGLATAIEFMPDSGIPDLPTARAVAEAAGLGPRSIIVDLWHLFASGGSLRDIAALPPGSIHAIQISDGPRAIVGAAVAPMTDRLLPGAGELDLAPAFAALRANTPDARIEVEVIAEGLRRLAAGEATAVMLDAARSWLAAQG